MEACTNILNCLGQATNSRSDFLHGAPEWAVHEAAEVKSKLQGRFRKTGDA